jgi:hypothetical protein
LVQQFGEINAPVLAAGIADDEFGTVPAGHNRRVSQGYKSIFRPKPDLALSSN